MEYTILILLLPFLSFILIGLLGTRLKPVAAGAFGTVVTGIVALLSYWTAFSYFGAGRNSEGIYPQQIPWNTEWLPFGGSLHIDLGILLDPISVMMLVVISTVSFMVHIYSFGYMKGETGFQRYYSFVCVFHTNPARKISIFYFRTFIRNLSALSLDQVADINLISKHTPYRFASPKRYSYIFARKSQSAAMI